MVPGQPSTKQGRQSNENIDDHTARCCSGGSCNQLQRYREDAVTILDRYTEKGTTPAFDRENGGVEKPNGDLNQVEVDIAEANMGQQSRGYKSDLLELLSEYRGRGLFSANP